MQRPESSPAAIVTKQMNKPAKFLLVGMAIAVLYFLWPKNSGPIQQISAQPSPAPASTAAIDASVSTDMPQPAIPPAAAQTSLNPLADRLAALRAKLRQWQESQMHDPDDEDGRARLLAEMLGMVTDETVADIIKSLSVEELNTPFGIGALHHWMQVDSITATRWLAAQPGSSAEQILAVAEDWTSNPDGLQQYLDQLPQSAWKQQFLEQASSAALSADPVEAIKLAGEMDSGGAQTNLLRSAACKWISTDPNAALNWIISVNDPSLREQLIASAAQSYALTDPSLSMDWLVSGVKSDAVARDAECNILQTWVSTDPASAANWVSGLPEGDLKMSAAEIVFAHWSQTDPEAANAWAQN